LCLKLSLLLEISAENNDDHRDDNSCRCRNNRRCYFGIKTSNLGDDKPDQRTEEPYDQT
jgi:hypothetical protein